MSERSARWGLDDNDRLKIMRHASPIEAYLDAKMRHFANLIEPIKERYVHLWQLTLYRLEAGRFASRLKARLKGTEENPSDPRHLIR